MNSIARLVSALGVATLCACGVEAPVEAPPAVSAEVSQALMHSCSGTGCCSPYNCCSCDNVCVDGSASVVVTLVTACPTGFTRSARYTGPSPQFVRLLGTSGNRWTFGVSQNSTCASLGVFTTPIPFSEYCSASGTSYPNVTKKVVVGYGASVSLSL